MFSVSVTGNYVLPGKYEIRPMVSPTNRLLVFFSLKTLYLTLKTRPWYPSGLFEITFNVIHLKPPPPVPIPLSKYLAHCTDRPGNSSLNTQSGFHQGPLNCSRDCKCNSHCRHRNQPWNSF